MARAAARKLCATAERAVLLHGDFVGKNLLRSGAGYVAIDPIPRIATHARTPAPSPPAIRPRPRSCSGRSHRRAYGPGPASERSAGQPSGLSCRPVRPGVKTSPTLKPACPAISSSTCSLSNAGSQILTTAMLVLPGPPKGPTPAQAPVQHLHQVSSGAQNSQICMPLPAMLGSVGLRHIGGNARDGPEQQSSRCATSVSASERTERRLGMPTEAIGMCDPMRAEHPFGGGGGMADGGPQSMRLTAPCSRSLAVAAVPARGNVLRVCPQASDLRKSVVDRC